MNVNSSLLSFHLLALAVDKNSLLIVPKCTESLLRVNQV